MIVAIIFLVLFSYAWSKAWVMSKLWDLETKRNRTDLSNKTLIQAYNNQIEAIMKIRKRWMI